MRALLLAVVVLTAFATIPGTVSAATPESASAPCMVVNDQIDCRIVLPVIGECHVGTVGVWCS